MFPTVAMHADDPAGTGSGWVVKRKADGISAPNKMPTSLPTTGFFAAGQKPPPQQDTSQWD